MNLLNINFVKVMLNRNPEKTAVTPVTAVAPN